ncbi:COG4223 family protein [Chelativorans sp. YIM 93263]|uniref:COG4223 family protein n=1 Tax=Chelativorans sp. YIM 93263 TaxID=2906648 RepID=UPI0023795B36|nr:hypothetical protein [Chelativorans sp. YIM 93263]
MAKPSRPRHSSRKREPVTIDLEPEAVEREPSQDGEKSAEVTSSEDKPVSDSAPGEEELQAEGMQPKGETQTAGGPTAPEAESDRSAADAQADETESAAKPEEGETPLEGEDQDGRHAPPPLEKRGSGRALLAGIAGGVIALVLGAGLQWANILPVPRGGEADPAVENLRQELSSVQETVSQLSQAQGDGGADEQLSQLESQVAELRETVSQLQSSTQGEGEQAGDALEERLSQIESDVASALQAATGAQQTAEANAQQLDGVAEQVGQLDERVSDQDQAPQLRLIVAAMALESAVESGAPFASELETYTALASDASAVEPLSQYADQGLPSAAALTREASQVTSRIAGNASDDSQDGGLLDKLMAGARSAVQVRPVGQVDGDSAEAVAARMEAAVQDENYAQALKEYEALPPEAQEIAADLAEKLRARQAADQIVEQALSSALQPA